MRTPALDVTGIDGLPISQDLLKCYTARGNAGHRQNESKVAFRGWEIFMGLLTSLFLFFLNQELLRRGTNCELNMAINLTGSPREKRARQALLMAFRLFQDYKGTVRAMGMQMSSRCSTSFLPGSPLESCLLQHFAQIQRQQICFPAAKSSQAALTVLGPTYA